MVSLLLQRAADSLHSLSHHLPLGHRQLRNFLVTSRLSSVKLLAPCEPINHYNEDNDGVDSRDIVHIYTHVSAFPCRHT